MRKHVVSISGARRGGTRSCAKFGLNPALACLPVEMRAQRRTSPRSSSCEGLRSRDTRRTCSSASSIAATHSARREA